MKRKLLFALVAGAVCSVASAASPSLWHPAADTPYPVQPAQGIVNMDMNMNGYGNNGVSSICITFPKELALNKSNTETAKLYFNDMEVPADETLATSIEPLDPKSGSVHFKGRKWTLTGNYRIEIPEGMFLVGASWDDDDSDPTGGEPSKAMTLYYNIFADYQVYPKTSIVKDLSDIVLYFPNADEVKARGVSVELNQQGTNLALLSGTAEDYFNEGKVNCVVYHSTVKEAGRYEIMIPSGAATYTVYGPNHATDPEDYVTYSSYSVMHVFNISDEERPEIYPEEGAVKSFTQFELKVPANIFYLDNITSNYLYRADASGDADKSASVALVKANNFAQAVHPGCKVLQFMDPESGEYMEGLTPAPGYYVLQLAGGLWGGMVNGAWKNSAPFSYLYEVESDTTGAEVIKPVDRITVYTLDGVCVVKNAEGAAFSALPAGMYIVNGKKIVKR